MFTKNKKEEILYMDKKEEKEVWELIKEDDRVTDKEVKKILFVEE
jgi:hypothetical protein